MTREDTGSLTPTLTLSFFNLDSIELSSQPQPAEAQIEGMEDYISEVMHATNLL